MWWLIPTVVLADVLEILGWSARLWSSISPTLLTPFEIQLVGTILAPTPFLAANFLVLGKIIIQLGPQYSRLSPKLYALIFCILDVICLIIQAVGGAYAANEVNQGQNPDNGGNIMLVGVTIQSCRQNLRLIPWILILIPFKARWPFTFFVPGEFLLRFLNDTPVRKNSMPVSDEKRCAKIVEWHIVKWLILGLVIQMFCLIVRSAYRTVELSNGWSGPIISTEAYFNVFDGLMMVIAVYTMNLIHPGPFLGTLPEKPGVTGGVDWPQHSLVSTRCAAESRRIY
ncbi:RTA-like protein [Pisolithus orientalis]|uniref:RTA-like protein n=1 Tax=Pisolithus orientalis TaxID=936130 RepID=UPI0022255411|nr:RTA-like protein [Pisolithus orientalis]KAI5998513.1 RTA-like protein [Pisolithus orientalis]